MKAVSSAKLDNKKIQLLKSEVDVAVSSKNNYISHLFGGKYINTIEVKILVDDATFFVDFNYTFNRSVFTKKYLLPIQKYLVNKYTTEIRLVDKILDLIVEEANKRPDVHSDFNYLFTTPMHESIEGHEFYGVYNQLYKYFYKDNIYKENEIIPLTLIFDDFILYTKLVLEVYEAESIGISFKVADMELSKEPFTKSCKINGEVTLAKFLEYNNANSGIKNLDIYQTILEIIDEENDYKKEDVKSISDFLDRFYMVFLESNESSTERQYKFKDKEVVAYCYWKYMNMKKINKIEFDEFYIDLLEELN